MKYQSFSLKATIPFLISAFFLLASSRVKAEEGGGNKNYVGLTTSFINGITFYGVNSKIGISDNISVRPFIELGNTSFDGANASVVFYGASATYDFNIPNSGISPYVGAGVGSASVSVGNASASAGGYYSEIGVDYNASDSFVVNANYKIGGSGYFSIAGGYRF